MCVRPAIHARSDAQTFAVPRTARKVKPFVDHVASFSVADGKIWFRNYQVRRAALRRPSDRSQILDAPVTEAVDSVASGSKPKRSKDAPKTTLSEIGPRCVLVPVKIFEGSFNGATVYENKRPSATSTRPVLIVPRVRQAGRQAHAGARGQGVQVCQPQARADGSRDSSIGPRRRARRSARDASRLRVNVPDRLLLVARLPFLVWHVWPVTDVARRPAPFRYLSVRCSRAGFCGSPARLGCPPARSRDSSHRRPPR